MKRGHGAEEVACWTSSLCSEDCAVEEPRGEGRAPLPSFAIHRGPAATMGQPVIQGSLAACLGP